MTGEEARDRKSTRLNSSHLGTSYAAFCFDKKDLRLPAPHRRRLRARSVPRPPAPRHSAPLPMRRPPPTPPPFPYTTLFRSQPHDGKSFPHIGSPPNQQHGQHGDP